LDAVVQRCLSKRKEDRYRSATALGRALALFAYRSSRTVEICAPQTERFKNREATWPGLQPLAQCG
jgi:hypothetical protein